MSQQFPPEHIHKIFPTLDTSSKMPPTNSRYIICMCSDCHTKNHMTPGGLQPGLPFLPSQYQKHLSRHPVAQLEQTFSTSQPSTSHQIISHPIIQQSPYIITAQPSFNSPPTQSYCGPILTLVHGRYQLGSKTTIMLSSQWCLHQSSIFTIKSAEMLQGSFFQHTI